VSDEELANLQEVIKVVQSRQRELNLGSEKLWKLKEEVDLNTMLLAKIQANQKPKEQGLQPGDYAKQLRLMEEQLQYLEQGANQKLTEVAAAHDKKLVGHEHIIEDVTRRLDSAAEIHAEQLVNKELQQAEVHHEEAGALGGRIHELEEALKQAHAELLAEMDRGGAMLTHDEAALRAEIVAEEARQLATEKLRAEMEEAHGEDLALQLDEQESARHVQDEELARWKERAVELEAALDEAEDDLQVVQEAHDALENELYRAQESGYDSRSQSRSVEPAQALALSNASRGADKIGGAELVKSRAAMTPEVKKEAMRENLKGAVLSMRGARKPITSLKDVRLKEKMWRNAKQLHDNSNK